MVDVSSKKIQETKQRFGIIGQSELLDHAVARAIKVAPTDLSVLITGKSGVGKEGFSQVIHHLSKRKHNKFIAINCGAIPEGTIDSELFGHEKGAFTSAIDTRKGYFETVNGGTIFLDEIGELPLATQSRLLRVLETGEFIKVGSSKVQKTDVRVLAATNKDLSENLKNKKFREDLYYRLSTVQIHIPTLQERKDDILMLFAKFATDFADQYNIPPIELTAAAKEMMTNYSWPGNIRQLKNFVEEISVLEANRTIDGETLKQYLPEEPSKELEHVNKEEEQQSFGSNNEEREILYKILFDLKNDVSELKKLMHQFFGTIHSYGQAGFNEDYTSNEHESKLLKAGDTKESEPSEVIKAESSEPEETEKPQPVYAEAKETLSLQEQEKEMIKKALEKFKGKRKAAAKELGISERTLYRKIKEYDLEEL